MGSWILAIVLNANVFLSGHLFVDQSACEQARNVVKDNVTEAKCVPMQALMPEKPGSEE